MITDDYYTIDLTMAVAISKIIPQRFIEFISKRSWTISRKNGVHLTNEKNRIYSSSTRDETDMGFLVLGAMQRRSSELGNCKF